MEKNPPLPNRQSQRLKEYDYTQPGAYFVTLVTWQRKCLFGEIVQGKMYLNLTDKIASNKLRSMPKHFPVIIDSWIIMPNHVHMILTITNQGPGEATAQQELIDHRPIVVASPLQNGTNRGSLGSIIQNYKSITSKQINLQKRTPGEPIWQRNYYERIIRDEIEMNNIHLYIVDNPHRWSEDPENKSTK